MANNEYETAWEQRTCPIPNFNDEGILSTINCKASKCALWQEAYEWPHRSRHTDDCASHLGETATIRYRPLFGIFKKNHEVFQANPCDCKYGEIDEMSFSERIDRYGTCHLGHETIKHIRR